MYALLSFLGEKMALIETSQNLIYCLEIIQCTHFLALTRNPQILPCFSFRRSPRQSFLLHWAPFLGVSSLSHHMSGPWNSGRKTTSKTLKSMLTYFARIWGQYALDLPLCKVQAPCFVLREVAPTPHPRSSTQHRVASRLWTKYDRWPICTPPGFTNYAGKMSHHRLLLAVAFREVVSGAMVLFLDYPALIWWWLQALELCLSRTTVHASQLSITEHTIFFWAPLNL